MKTSRNMRIGWGLALAATLVAAWFAPTPQDDSVALTSRVAAIQPTHSQQNISAAAVPTTGFGIGAVMTKGGEKSVTNVQVLRIRNRSYPEDEEISVFGKVVWEPPSAAVEVQPTDLPPPQPEIPTAPALPFRLMGRYEEGGKSIAFLLQADQSWIVREGETFAETYKVERIAANTIHLRYLPLNEVQVLEMDVAP